MNIKFGQPQGTPETTLVTEHRTAQISLDKNEKVVLELGINRVEIEYVDGSWTVTNGPNITQKLLSQQDQRAFCIDINP